MTSYNHVCMKIGDHAQLPGTRFTLPLIQTGQVYADKMLPNVKKTSSGCSNLLAYQKYFLWHHSFIQLEGDGCERENIRDEKDGVSEFILSLHISFSFMFSDIRHPEMCGQQAASYLRCLARSIPKH